MDAISNVLEKQSGVPAEQAKQPLTPVAGVGVAITSDGSVVDGTGKKVGEATELEAGKSADANAAATPVSGLGVVVKPDGSVVDSSGKVVGKATELPSGDQQAGQPIAGGAGSGQIEFIDNNKISNDAAFTAEKATGVDHMRIAHYPGGEHLKIGYNQAGAMIRIDGNNVYRNLLTQADLQTCGITTGQTGWYIQEATGFRKMPFENYTFDENTNTFRSQFTDSVVGQFNLDGSERIARSNGSATDIKYQRDGNGNFATDANGQKVVAGFMNFASNGMPMAEYVRQGDNFILVPNPAIPDLPTSLSNVKFDANGNMSYESVPRTGTMIIVRGDGTELEAKSDAAEYKNTRIEKPEFEFDNLGRIKRIVPGPDALAKGARVRDFYYAGSTNELAKVIVQNPAVYPGLFFIHERQGNSQTWTCKCQDQYGREYLDQYGRQWWAPQGDHTLSPTGEYIYQDFIGGQIEKK